MLNPNCSEVVWKLNIKTKGRTEHTFDSSSWDSWGLMDELVSAMGDNQNVNKVQIKIVEDMGASFNSLNSKDALNIALKLAKKAKKGEMTTEEASKKFDAIIGV